jgi:hypothetical protein
MRFDMYAYKDVLSRVNVLFSERERRTIRRLRIVRSDGEDTRRQN